MTAEIGMSLHVASSVIDPTYTEMLELSFPSASLTDAVREEIDRIIRLFCSIAQPMDGAQHEKESVFGGWIEDTEVGGCKQAEEREITR